MEELWIECLTEEQGGNGGAGGSGTQGGRGGNGGSGGVGGDRDFRRELVDLQ